MTEQAHLSPRIIEPGTEIRPDASVVVIDVIRSFTCATIALAQKAEAILCVNSLEHARELKLEHPDYVLIGEERGLKPEGFDFGNSPEEYSLASFCDKQLVQRSTNGTRSLIEAAGGSSKLWAASALNASATARAVMNTEQQAVDLIVTDPSTSEDRACAEYITKIITGDRASKLDLRSAILRGGGEHQALWHRRRTSEELRQFERDVKNCSQVDQYNFAIAGRALTDQVVALTLVR